MTWLEGGAKVCLAYRGTPGSHWLKHPSLSQTWRNGKGSRWIQRAGALHVTFTFDPWHRMTQHTSRHFRSFSLLKLWAYYSNRMFSVFFLHIKQKTQLQFLEENNLIIFNFSDCVEHCVLTRYGKIKQHTISYFPCKYYKCFPLSGPTLSLLKCYSKYIAIYITLHYYNTVQTFGVSKIKNFNY